MQGVAVFFPERMASSSRYGPLWSDDLVDEVASMVNSAFAAEVGAFIP
jgi:hypothetical protein